MKKISRREFLQTSATVGAYACCAAAFGVTSPQVVFGQTSGGTGNLAIMFNQFGGCDPLNSFAIPFGVGKYYDLRPTIAIPAANVLNLNGSLGFHPSLSNLHRMFLDGDVAVIFGTGDPVGTRSHFTSQDIMSLGASTNSTVEKRGWIGRLGDLYFPNDEFNTFALGVGQRLDFIGNRLTNPVLTVPKLDKYQMIADVKNGNPAIERDSELQVDVASQIYQKQKTLGGIRNSARLSVARAHRDSVTVQQTLAQFPPGVTYPATRAGAFFSDASVLARSPLGARMCYGGMGGWDNHSTQGAVTGVQAGLLNDLDDAFALFATEMKGTGKWNKVTTCVFTEFGRTIKENTSLGTDHGWGSVMLVIGGAVKGGVYGTAPTNAQLNDNRWLLPEIDYRNPFREIVQWMGYDAEPVFTDQYVRKNLGLFA